MKRQIDWIVLHCTGTDKAGQSVAEIRRWQTEKSFNGGKPLSDVAYHYVIVHEKGEIQVGRPEDQPGAGEPGYNHNGIHVCLAGNTRFVSDQFISLENLLRFLKQKFPNAKLVGHVDINKGPAKRCPVFETAHWKYLWANLPSAPSAPRTVE